MPRRNHPYRNRKNATTGVGISELLEAKRRYANARRRARFWSGTLTFNIHLRSKETRSSRLAEKYELAMCDCKSWEQTIGELTGKKLKHYDPRAEFAARWSKLKFASNSNYE